MDNNSLTSLNFKFKLQRTPELEYRVQNVVIPGMELGSADIPSPFVPIKTPGNLSYGDLAVTFIVGENLRDYLEIFNWMTSLGHPDNFEQFPERYSNSFSDASVIIMNSSSNPIMGIDFTDTFPVSISPLNFDVTQTSLEYVHATAVFRFTRFYYKPII